MPLRKNASDVVLCHRPINAKELASIVDDIFALDHNKATAGAGVAYSFKKKRKDAKTKVTGRQAEIEQQWDDEVKANYAKAKELAEKAAAML